ncbi:ABC transporter ATP-binding protein [Ruegeria sp. HKCCD8929]|uniref:ABC transporter ATP-binding protein n=1 Tax=Ruegeria sp. HKCCD8929 TaxID=2683006 RepID=UPI001489AAA0|nr:ABC transporter ATP-binding protein [Ruegeria sp. HKCCD8929]
MSTGQPLLQTRGLCKHFGGVKALHNVDFSLAKGELRCLIGPNGAGKSTFFKTITGQYAPTKGEVLLNGAPIGGIETSAIAKRGVGIKTQVPNVFDGLSVRENVWVAVRGTKDKLMRNEIVQKTLERMGIAHISGETVGQLAHGQRQFVELSMVIAEDPELILLDEPAAGLSAEETTRLAEIIHELNQSHALIVVEHDMQFIRMIGKQVTVFHQGEILIEDTTEAILSNERVRDVYLGKSAA